MSGSYPYLARDSALDNSSTRVAIDARATQGLTEKLPE